MLVILYAETEHSRRAPRIIFGKFRGRLRVLAIGGTSGVVAMRKGVVTKVDSQGYYDFTVFGSHSVMISNDRWICAWSLTLFKKDGLAALRIGNDHLIPQSITIEGLKVNVSQGRRRGDPRPSLWERL